MKTLVENSTKISKYVFEDSVAISLEDTQVVTSDFIIADLNKNTATLFENVTVPEGWEGNKYTFDGEVWEAL